MIDLLQLIFAAAVAAHAELYELVLHVQHDLLERAVLALAASAAVLDEMERRLVVVLLNLDPGAWWSSRPVADGLRMVCEWFADGLDTVRHDRSMVIGG